jgi:hypothetical protein
VGWWELQFQEVCVGPEALKNESHGLAKIKGSPNQVSWGDRSIGPELVVGGPLRKDERIAPVRRSFREGERVKGLDFGMEEGSIRPQALEDVRKRAI